MKATFRGPIPFVLGFVLTFVPGTGTSQDPRDGRTDRSYAWIAAEEGEAIPRDAVRGARETDRAPNWVCRARYEGGVHPGRWVGGLCHVGYGGKEVVLQRYEVLAGARDGWWGAPKSGPDAGFEAGSEKGRPLVLCRADYRGELNPGKVVSGVCNFGWGGREISADRYEVFHLSWSGRDRERDWGRAPEPYAPWPPDPEPSAPFEICSDQRVPRGLVVVKASRDMKCPNWSATDFNVYTVKRPGENEEICSSSPTPYGYVVVSEGLNWNCPGWTATGKNTKKIRRY